jgi:hypothetical protein
MPCSKRRCGEIWWFFQKAKVLPIWDFEFQLFLTLAGLD